MKTINSERIKNLKSSMRRINELLNNYQAMEEAQYKSRNTTVYDAAGEQMKYAYKTIISEMNVMLNSIDMLGLNCGELEALDYNRIEKHTYNV